MQRTQYPIVITIVIMAVITAVGLFLAWSYILRRPELPEGSYRTVVEGVELVVNQDPDKQVYLINPLPDQTQLQPDNQSTQPEPSQPAAGTEQATETPIPPPEPTATPIPDSVIFIDYVVQPNETMYSVALRLDTSIALMAQEGIAQDKLVPGQTIKLPVGNPAYCPGKRPYAVAEGDTAYNISRTLNVPLDVLKTLNNLNDNFDIKAAQILCIP
ncbi:MAG: LysM peptidoglycan-binding domain-containing protein [Ardenticatenaceae bacterium]|nr:LysM peptidoglycan-binding domain-containing protein [Ardenticatenaceae bacterium]MCB9444271.1 LysM peptidoglycan-binding domain-containing protein [Ardenticatenaceae bacterium]